APVIWPLCQVKGFVLSLNGGTKLHSILQKVDILCIYLILLEYFFNPTARPPLNSIQIPLIPSDAPSPPSPCVLPAVARFHSAIWDKSLGRNVAAAPPSVSPTGLRTRGARCCRHSADRPGDPAPATRGHQDQPRAHTPQPAMRVRWRAKLQSCSRP